MKARLLLLGWLMSLAPQLARAEAVRLTGEALDLSVDMTAAAPEAPAVGGQADLKARLLSFDTTARLAVQTGSTPLLQDGWSPIAAGRAGSWTSGRFDLGATWAPTERARLQLSADGQTRSQLDPADLIWNASTDRYVRSSQTTARAAATLKPLKAWDIEVGGEASVKSLRTQSLAADGPQASDLLTTGVRQGFATLRWRLAPRLNLEGGGKVETIDVAWAGAGARGGAYGYLEPRVAAVATPWKGASWRLSAERAVSPLREDQFLAFAQTVGAQTVGAQAGATGSAFEPGREWRFQASFQQVLAEDLAFTATLTRARLQSVVDFGPVGMAEAPTDIGRGERSEIAASLAAPSVDLPGLPTLSVKLRGAWRASTVEDGFTGAQRRLSGETPYDAELSIVPAAPGAALRWGVSAHAAGAIGSWRMNQVASRAPSAGLSGFVAYNPGPLAIRLNLENLVGGGYVDREMLFAGPRSAGLVERVSESRSADRAVRLTFSRQL